MREVGGRVGVIAGGLLHEILREKSAAVFVNVLLHPGEEREEVTPGEGGGNGGVF